MTTSTRSPLDAGLTVGQVASKAGVSANAVRYYERYRIITAERTAGNARRFTIDAVCRIRLAVAAQRVGLSLAESAEILAEIPPMSSDLEQWSRAGQRLVDAGQARIAELAAVVDEYRTLAFIRG
ncbi:MerR family transcriptional regulator, redox-sensitive transcriptional activator SoxR [Amycolatopsis lurida]|uniref:Transcriptional regulator n=1 Tax=Amycolatopsis lurida NRRL 2430 TaxID=1460371 RepID=A0A2P2G0L8_AMYLU|nr:MerR family transcriptional regulator [Amycolatopsis lurida]KFU82519.1 transcriptional regulator [Amycolatopsis lurida NRRL 2430]SEB40491.1 MerR family transcriptional regulator, redox-sensitive transcriptional activator SoxR [Amycolatopsis lurida]